MDKLNWDFINYLASLLLTGITTLGLGIFVLLKNRASKLNRVFFAFSLSISIWAFSQSCIHYLYTPAWIGAHIEHPVIPFIPVFFLHFVMILTDRHNKIALRSAYITAACFSLVSAFTSTIVKDLDPMQVTPTFRMEYSIKPGELYGCYAIFFALVVACAFYILYREYRVSTGARRNQLKYLLFGSIIGFSGGGVNFCYVFKIHIYPFVPFATYGVPIYVFIAAYAIVKHKLMDIKVAFGRTGILALIYGSIIYSSFQFVAVFKPHLEDAFGRYWAYVPIGIYTILVTVAPFLYLYMQRKFEEKLFRKQRQYQRALKHLSADMTRMRDLNRLLGLTVIQIVRAVRVSHASIFLYDKDKKTYILSASRGPMKKPLSLSIPATDYLIQWIYKTKKPVIIDEMDKAADLKQFKQRMKELDAAVLLPGFIEGRLIGFMILGEKLSGEIYTQGDLDTFETLANQTVLAIDNAQAYHELRDTRDQLVRGEQLATIGRFASEVAHEIKNPLQAIKTFAELINEKYNDKEFREKFSKLASSEIDRIDDFVRKLVKVANPTLPKLSSVDVKEVLNSVLDLMENDFISKNITVKKQYESSSAMIIADKDQLKQVFLNLVSNAIDAMEGSKDKALTASVSLLQGRAVIKIADTGCGIPAESIPKIFNPLFTTKEKGTGLGLNIVDTIIKNHQGTIEVESKVGEGTVFTITI